MRLVWLKHWTDRIGFGSKLGPLLLALLLQSAVLGLAVLLVVVVPEFKSEPAFVARKKVYLPQKELEHRVALANFQNAASAPTAMERIQTEALLPDGLPDLPQLTTPEVSASALTSALPGELLFSDARLSGALEGLSAEASRTSLFGVSDRGRRVVVLFDNSRTVLNKADALGVSDTAFVHELDNMIQQLGPNTLFGIVLFAQQVGTYRDYLVAAGARNKEASRQWLVDNVRSMQKSTAIPYDENGIQGALTVAFSFEPEVIYILSDGDFQRGRMHGSGSEDVPFDALERTLRSLVREYGTEPRIHFIGFDVAHDAATALRRLTKRHGGQYSQFGISNRTSP